jgi:hypothetical protein
MDPVLVARWTSGPGVPGGAAGHPRSRTGCGAIQASGSRSARSSCASVRASTLSFFEPGRGDRHGSGWGGPGAAPGRARPAGRPASPNRRRPRSDRGAGWQVAQDRQQLGGVVGQVAVALLVAGVVNDDDLRALAVDVDTDVHAHQGLLPRARVIPEAYGCRAEQGWGPDLHSIRSGSGLQLAASYGRPLWASLTAPPRVDEPIANDRVAPHDDLVRTAAERPGPRGDPGKRGRREPAAQGWPGGAGEQLDDREAASSGVNFNSRWQRGLWASRATG